MAERGRNKIVRISYGAILSAFAVVLLVMGGALELLDMTSATIASLVILVSALKFGVGHSLTVYAVSSCLGFIFMPTASSVWYYVLVIGYFPSLYLYLEKKTGKKWLRYAVKAAIFNIGVTAALLLFIKLYGLSQIITEFSLFGEHAAVTLVLIYALLNVFFAAYNIFLSRMKFLCCYFLRKGRKRKKNF